MSDHVHTVGDALRERAEHEGERIRAGYESAREVAAVGLERTEGLISGHPMSSVLLAFGMGFGAGVILSIALTQREESWVDRYLRRPMREIPERLRHMHLPDAVARHMT
jgi:hypothetical protein